MGNHKNLFFNLYSFLLFFLFFVSLSLTVQAQTQVPCDVYLGDSIQIKINSGCTYITIRDAGVYPGEISIGSTTQGVIIEGDISQGLTRESFIIEEPAGGSTYKGRIIYNQKHLALINVTVRGSSRYNIGGGETGDYEISTGDNEWYGPELEEDDIHSCIYNFGYFWLINSIVENCYTSTNGAGLSNYFNSKSWITDSLFQNNFSSEMGGALYSEQAAFLSVNDSYFYRNAAQLFGGAIASDDTDLLIDGTTFDQNQSYDNSNSNLNGGAIFCRGTSATTGTLITKIENSNFLLNQAYEGGAIYSLCDGMLIDGSKFTFNKSDNKGGAIFHERYPSYGKIDILRSNISNNSSTRDGGGIYFYGSEVNISDSFFENNKSGSQGGGIFTIFVPVFNMSRTLVKGNEATTNGGGMYAYNSVGNITGDDFSENAAENGGAFYLKSSVFDLSDSSAHYNKASISGGAILSRYTDLTLNRVVQNGNIATDHGGSMSITLHYNTLTVSNSQIYGSGKDQQGGFYPANFGGALYLTGDNSDFILENSTLYDNLSQGGDSLSLRATSSLNFYLKNSIIYDHNSPASCYFSNNVNTQISGTVISGNASCLPTITADPQLTASSTNPDILVPTRRSISIDIGDNAYCSSTTDILGNTRIVDGNGDGTATCDVGAAEYF